MTGVKIKNGKALVAGLAIVTMITIILSGCGGRSEKSAVKAVDWQYEQTIPEDIIMQAADEDITIGDLQTHGASVFIPADSFKEETIVKLKHPEEQLQVNVNEFNPVGIPIEIQVDNEQRRTSNPVTITLAIDIQSIEEDGQVYAVYFNETNGWDYIVPEAVNLQERTMTFTTYHFSTYAPAILEEDARVKEFVNRKSVEQWVSHNVEDEGISAQEEMVKAILEQGMGISDQSVLSIITEAVVSELPGGKMGLALINEDYEKITQEVLQTTSKTLAVLTKEGTLKDVAGEPGHIIAAARASAAALEGEPQEALEHMAEHIVSYIVDKTPVVKELSKVGKVWVKIVDHKINVWNHEETEKAYQVYRDGASSRVPFWGYNVEPGNFEDVWDQMNGISAKITRDAIQSYCDARGIHPDNLSFEEANRIRESAKQRMKTQFEQRAAQETEIEKIREENMKLLEIFQDKGLLDRSFGNPMYTEHDNLDSLMRRLYHMVEKIKRDTGRTEIISTLHGKDRAYDDVGKLRSDEVLMDDLAALIWVWYNQGPEGYNQKIIELGYLRGEIDIVGTWVNVHEPRAELFKVIITSNSSGTFYDYSKWEGRGCTEIPLVFQDGIITGSAKAPITWGYTQGIGSLANPCIVTCSFTGEFVEENGVMLFVFTGTIHYPGKFNSNSLEAGVFPGEYIYTCDEWVEKSSSMRFYKVGE